MTVGVNGPVALVAKVPVGDDEVERRGHGRHRPRGHAGDLHLERDGRRHDSRADGLRRGEEREGRRRPGAERPPVVRERRAVEVARAPGALSVGAARADARVGRRGRRVADRRGEPVEHRTRLAREVARERAPPSSAEPRRSRSGRSPCRSAPRGCGARRPRPTRTAASGRRSNERPPERRAPLPRSVRERAARVREERVRRAGGGPAGEGEQIRVPEVARRARHAGS